MSHGTSLSDAYTLISENKETYKDSDYASVGAATPTYYTDKQAPPPTTTAQYTYDASSVRDQVPMKSTMIQNASANTYMSMPLPSPLPNPVPPKQQKVQHEQVHSHSPSYFDQLGSKRKEMIKVAGYALMILFALALYTGIDFLIKDVIEKNDLSFKQELGLRFAYPLLILVVLWNFKLIN